MTWALDKGIKTGTRIVITVNDPPTGRERTLPSLMQNPGEADAAFISRAKTALNSHLAVMNGELQNEVDITAQLRGGAQGGGASAQSKQG